MTGRTNRFDERVLACVPDDGGLRDATQIWEMMGGRYGWAGRLTGPSLTHVMKGLERLAAAGSVREQRVERVPGLFHLIYDRRTDRAPAS